MPVQESTDQQVHARRAHQEICENLLYDPQGRAHPRCRAPGIGCEAGLGLAPIGRMSRTERSIRHCRATPGRRFRFRRDRWFWVAMRTGSWCVVRGVAQGHPATHAAAYRDRGPALGLWAGTLAPGSGSSPGWRPCGVGRPGAGRQHLALRAPLAAGADADRDGP